MKKHFLSVFATLTMLLLTFSMASCSDSDEDEDGDGTITESTLVGKWVLVASEGYEIYNGKKDTWNEVFDPADKELVVTINKNGRMNSAWYDDDYTEGSWVLNGNKLITQSDDDEETVIQNVVKLTSSTLVLELQEEDYFEKSTFKKIK